MSENMVAKEISLFCHKTGRTRPETVQVATFDFSPGSEDRKAFIEWLKNNGSLEYFLKYNADWDALGEGPLREGLGIDDIPKDRWATTDKLFRIAAREWSKAATQATGQDPEVSR